MRSGARRADTASLLASSGSSGGSSTVTERSSFSGGSSPTDSATFLFPQPTPVSFKQQQSSSNSSTPTNPPLFSSSTPGSILSERDQLKLEFYKTYDVMTGVRIAATLGGFFSLMVFFVVYKSRCGRGKSISSNDIAAAAAELDAISELPFDGFYSLTAPRRSLGNMSAPAAVRTRFSTSSYVSMTDYQAKSLPGSVLGFQHPPGWSESAVVMQDGGGISPHLPSSNVQNNNRTVLHNDNSSYSRGSSFLVVPGVRLSSTGSSSDSSYYLEHHGSVELSLPPAPRPRRYWRRSTLAAPSSLQHQEIIPINFSSEDYPIDINVIQPTPDISPCGSERQLYRHQRRNSSQWSTCGGLLAAPLASIGSASLTDYPESDIHSIGSDSVFYNEDYFTSESSEDAATCESSDTESESSDEVCATSAHRIRSPQPRRMSPPPPQPQQQVEFSQFLQVPQVACLPARSVSPHGRWANHAIGGYHPKRRLSSPAPVMGNNRCETISEQVQAAVKLGSDLTAPDETAVGAAVSASSSGGVVTSLTIPAVCLPLRQTGGSLQEHQNDLARDGESSSIEVKTTETLF